MSAHKNDDSRLRGALIAHHLTVDAPSQLSDAFRAGVRWADGNPAQPAATPAAPLGSMTSPHTSPGGPGQPIPMPASAAVQEQAAPSDAEIAALAQEHIATGYAKMREACPELPEYEGSEQFARIKAFARALLARHGVQPAASAEPIYQTSTSDEAGDIVWVDTSAAEVTPEYCKRYNVRKLYAAPVAAQAQPEFFVPHETLRRALCNLGIAAPESDGEIGADMDRIARRIIEAVAAQASGQPQPSGNAGEFKTDDQLGGLLASIRNYGSWKYAEAKGRAEPDLSDVRAAWDEVYEKVQALAAQVSGQAQDAEERTRYLIEKKSVLPVWEEVGPAHSSLENALEALPYYRKDTNKDLRIVRERRKVVHVDAARQESKGGDQ